MFDKIGLNLEHLYPVTRDTHMVHLWHFWSASRPFGPVTVYLFFSAVELCCKNTLYWSFLPLVWVIGDYLAYIAIDIIFFFGFTLEIIFPENSYSHTKKQTYYSHTHKHSYYSHTDIHINYLHTHKHSYYSRTHILLTYTHTTHVHTNSHTTHKHTYYSHTHKHTYYPHTHKHTYYSHTQKHTYSSHKYKHTYSSNLYSKVILFSQVVSIEPSCAENWQACDAVCLMPPPTLGVFKKQKSWILIGWSGFSHYIGCQEWPQKISGL